MKINKVVIILFLSAVAIGLVHLARNRQASYAYAYGPLTIDLGVASGSPIFTVENMLPGDCEGRSISITNDRETSVDLVVHSDNVVDTDSLSDALKINISHNGSLYNNSLKNFFTESQTLNGVGLLAVSSGDTKTVNFDICMGEEAGNIYQNTKVIFDLIFGETMSPFELPDECLELTGKIAFKIEGTHGRDDIRGTRANELIFGYGDDDKLDGAGGNDCIIGGSGHDKIDGGQGNDYILGSEGNDSIDGGQGKDKIWGGSGNDTIDAGQGDDYVSGGHGDDSISGRSGDDNLYGDDSIDHLDGGSGHDKCVGETIDSCEE